MTPEYTTGSGIALMRQSQGEKGFGDSEEGKDREEEQPLGEDGRVPYDGQKVLPLVQNGKIQNGRVGNEFGGQSRQLTSSNSELLKYGDKVGGVCRWQRSWGRGVQNCPWEP